jgi:hypothetical protein
MAAWVAAIGAATLPPMSAKGKMPNKRKLPS